MDDETAEKLKAFLHDKLSEADHAMACGLIDGEPAAEDDELPKAAVDRRRMWNGMGADDEAKGRADFYKQFPDASRIRIDNSGIQPRRRASSYSAADAASFTAKFPQASRIKLA
jgi:hypothetical protein